MRYCVEVLGCKVNQYESEQIRRLLELKGMSEARSGEGGDLVVIHSCAVTSQAVRKVRQFVRRSRSRNPAAIMIVTGCAAEPGIVDEDLPECRYIRPGKGWLLRLDRCLADLGWGGGLEEGMRLARISHQIPAASADSTAIAAQNDKVSDCGMSIQLHRHLAVLHHTGSTLHTLATKSGEKCGLESDMLPLQQFRGHQRAFLKIQDGCDIGCSYCIVPSLRGGSRDKPLAEIVEEARMLVAKGHKEIVVTGVSVGLYGKRSGIALAEGMERLAVIDGVERLRISSLHPGELTGRLLDVWSRHPNIMPHIHLPLQSGSDRVLAAMGRGYTREEFLAAIERAEAMLDRPAFNTDVIVGFPGESERDFEDTVALCREAGFSRMHIFPYSPRPGTNAAGLKNNVPSSEIKRRAAYLKQTAKELELDFYRRAVGQECRVLIERVEKDVCRGYSERYIPVSLPGDNNQVGQIKPVRLERIVENGMAGQFRTIHDH